MNVQEKKLECKYLISSSTKNGTFSNKYFFLPRIENFIDLQLCS